MRLARGTAPVIDEPIEVREETIRAEQMFIDSYLITPREMETIRLVAQGLTNPEITVELGVCIQTVKFHMTNILKKLAVKNRGRVILIYLNALKGE